MVMILLVTLVWFLFQHLWLLTKLKIDTLSYKNDAKAVKWVCDGGIEYEIGEGKS